GSLQSLGLERASRRFAAASRAWHDAVMAASATAGTSTEKRVPILVVDDDGDIRLALEMILQYQGFEVWTAKDGDEALKRLDAEEQAGRKPGLVMTDLKMPGLDGMALLERIAARPSPPPVVMISGHGDVAPAVEAVTRGAPTFPEKPLD